VRKVLIISPIVKSSGEEWKDGEIALLKDEVASLKVQLRDAVELAQQGDRFEMLY